MTKNSSDFSAQEFTEKFSRPSRPTSFAQVSLARNALAPPRDDVGLPIDDQLTEQILLVHPAESLEEHASDLTAAITWILFYLRVPSKLRVYIDILVGLAANSARIFPAPDVVVGICARQGSLPPQAEDPEEELAILDAWVEEQIERGESERNAKAWAARQRHALAAFQTARNFEFIKIIPGDYDPEVERNRPTQYQVHLLSFASETILRARSNPLWHEDPEGGRGRERAIRMAAHDLILDLPEAPPIKVKESRPLSDEDLLNRHYKMIQALMGKCRDLMRKNSHRVLAAVRDEEEQVVGFRLEPAWMGEEADEREQLAAFFEPLFERSRRVAYEPVLGYLDEEEPDQAAEAETGTQKYVPLPEGENTGPPPILHQFPTPEPAESPPPREGDTKMCTRSEGELCPDESRSAPPGEKVMSILKNKEGDTIMGESPEYRERLERMYARIRQAAFELERRFPLPTSEMKARGCVEIAWDDQSEAALRSEKLLDEAIIAYAFDDVDDETVRVAWEEYVRVRKRRWKDGIPMSFKDEPDF